MSASIEKPASDADPSSPTSGTQKQVPSDLKRKNQQLKRENDELRSLCSFLEQKSKRNLQLAAEWQTFGKYTASVLKKEVETYETKMKLMEEQLKKLATENKELREMCIYLNRSREEESTVQLTPPETTELLVHTRILTELNKRGGGIVPVYRGGLASDVTLREGKSSGKERQLSLSGGEPSGAMAEMKTRVEQLEREKLELIQFLSAAHLLAANTHKLDDPSPLYPSQQKTPPVDTPPDLASFLKQGAPLPVPTPPGLANGPAVSQDTIMTAVTLLDVCRRLDAADVNGYADPRDEMEATTLRVLLGIAWQRLQEQMQGDNITTNKQTM